MKVGPKVPVITDMRHALPVVESAKSTQRIPVRISNGDLVIRTPEQVGYYIYKANYEKSYLTGTPSSSSDRESRHMTGSIIRIAV